MKIGLLQAGVGSVAALVEPVAAQPPPAPVPGPAAAAAAAAAAATAATAAVAAPTIAPVTPHALISVRMS